MSLNALQLELLRAAERKWGEAAAGFFADLIAADTRKLDEWLHRMPYYFDAEPSALVHCRPLAVRRFSHEELCRHALGEPLRCWLLVLTSYCRPSRHRLMEGMGYGLPWLPFLEHATCVAGDLIAYRRSYLGIEDPRLARALFDHIPKKSAPITGQLFPPPQGERIAG